MDEIIRGSKARKNFSVVMELVTKGAWGDVLVVTMESPMVGPYFNKTCVQGSLPSVLVS
jgi:hypothetical protein